MFLHFCEMLFLELLYYNCSDIDECERQMDDCSVYSNCSNTEGSFICACYTGYEGDGVNCTSNCTVNSTLKKGWAYFRPSVSF